MIWKRRSASRRLSWLPFLTITVPPDLLEETVEALFQDVEGAPGGPFLYGPDGGHLSASERALGVEG